MQGIRGASRIERLAVVFEFQDDVRTHDFKSDRYCVVGTSPGKRVPDDVGDDLLEHQLAAIPGTGPYSALAERPSELKKASANPSLVPGKRSRRRCDIADCLNRWSAQEVISAIAAVSSATIGMRSRKDTCSKTSLTSGEGP